MGRNAIDLTGKTFGRLTVISSVSQPKNIKVTKKHWLCNCECGNQVIVRGVSLRNGHTQSCGCFKKERVKEGLNKTHGFSKTRRYETDKKMKRRCYNSNSKEFKDYGGRGIKICDEWLDKDNGFINFYTWSNSHGYKEDLTIDRIDVNQGYSPENCRWVDYSIQNFNRRTPKNNTSGRVGVEITSCGKYKASIRKNGKSIYLGTFATFNEACRAREQAERGLFK